MATKKAVEKDPEVSIEKALSRTELFFENNGKILLIVLLVITLGVGGYFAYKHIYSAPRADKAGDAMFEAQINFERDSFAQALNGVKGVFMGFDEVMAEFDGTPQANLAAHYAGICCMRTGDFARAITYFEKFKPVENGVSEILVAQNSGLMGDCYIEMGNAEKGVELYHKAIAASTSDATAPIYTQKAAIALYVGGKYSESLELFRSLQGNYPRSMEAREADKYIALVEQKL